MRPPDREELMPGLEAVGRCDIGSTPQLNLLDNMAGEDSVYTEVGSRGEPVGRLS